MIAVLVGVGALVGAPVRYLADRAVQARHASLFPWGTLGVNLTGSVILGLLAGLGSDAGPATAALIGIGFCGAFSTFSAFSYETLRLGEHRAFGLLSANVAFSAVAGPGLAALGWGVGSALHAG
jgi:fluoride exporter